MEMKEGAYCYNCGAELAKTYAEKEIIKRLEQENAMVGKKYKELQEDYKRAGETWEHLCKKKDKEIEFWKSEHDDDHAWVDVMQDQIDKLEQENAELKEKLIARGKSILACFALEEVDKYKQTLNAIKKIAEQRDYLNYGEALDDILDLITKAR